MDLKIIAKPLMLDIYGFSGHSYQILKFTDTGQMTKLNLKQNF